MLSIQTLHFDRWEQVQVLPGTPIYKKGNGDDALA